MIHELMIGTADFGLSGTADILNRGKVVDFTLPVYTWRFAAFFLHPNLRRDNFALIKPFDKYLWVAIIVSVINLGIVTVTFQKILSICPRKCRQSEKSAVEAVDEGPLALWAMNMLCSRSIPHIPSQSSVMTVALCGFCFGLLLNATYSAMLFSFLSLPLNSLSSLDDLLQNSYSFGTLGSPIIDLFMVTATLVKGSYACGTSVAI